MFSDEAKLHRIAHEKLCWPCSRKFKVEFDVLHLLGGMKSTEHVSRASPLHNFSQFVARLAHRRVAEYIKTPLGKCVVVWDVTDTPLVADGFDIQE